MSRQPPVQRRVEVAGRVVLERKLVEAAGRAVLEWKLVEVEVNLKIAVGEEADLKRLVVLPFLFPCLCRLFQEVLFPSRSDLPKAVKFSLSLLATHPRPFRSHFAHSRLRQLLIGVRVSASRALQIYGA